MDQLIYIFVLVSLIVKTDLEKNLVRIRLNAEVYSEFNMLLEEKLRSGKRVGSLILSSDDKERFRYLVNYWIQGFNKDEKIAELEAEIISLKNKLKKLGDIANGVERI